MDYLQFFAEVIKAITWPSAVVTLALLFKPQLSDLIQQLSRLLRRTKKVKYKDAEAEFAEQARKIQSEASKLPRHDVAVESPETAGELVKLLAKHDPRASILASWTEIELLLRKAVEVHKISLSERDMRSPRELIRALESNKIIDAESCKLIEQLRALRNKAAHLDGADMTEEDALNFAEAAKVVAAFLRRVGGQRASTSPP